VTETKGRVRGAPIEPPINRANWDAALIFTLLCSLAMMLILFAPRGGANALKRSFARPGALLTPVVTSSPSQIPHHERA
jgi:hypothetical protein